MPMPALSPTMTEGSIGKWNLKEGDKFEAGQSICDVETDKASMSLDATDEGYIAKILVAEGTTITVGAPIVVTVEEFEDVAAFSSFTISSSDASPPTPAAVAEPVIAATPVSTPVSSPTAPTPAPAPVSSSGDRLFASPLARKLAREAGLDLSTLIPALGLVGTGPGGRVVAADVIRASTMAAPAPPTAAPAVAAPAVSAVAPTAAAPQVAAKPLVSFGDVYSDFELSDLSKALAARLTAAKQEVPHYYLSVELDLTKLLSLRQELNANGSNSIGTLDMLVKASAMAMKHVPDVNASWMSTFVRRYDQVDINLVMGAGNFVATPVIKDAASMGVGSISKAIAKFEDSLFADSDEASPLLSDPNVMSIGTFSVHHLGMYGVKSAAPIVLSPQACALSLGAIVDTVVPNLNKTEGSEDWAVAPIMTATLSCDHRVVDGAVGAQWLQAFKALVENPITMIL